MTKKPTEIIAIDGPAASGKSTLGKRVADELGYLYFDTGVMYRAVTWAALKQNVPVNDEQALVVLIERMPIVVRRPSKDDGRSCDVLVAGQDVTWEIHSPEVDEYVSVVAAHPKVRQALTAQQRRIGQVGRVVMVGRDIGTVVLPEAGLKVFLNASAEVRALRRYIELRNRGEQASLEQILEKIYLRDRLDSTRSVAPLRPAEDAVIINSNKIDAEQVLERVRALLY
ncbi:MAG: (d)CMP kinase [Anaerolineales bacterium]|nr:(d)CMP kinase [Anaerolineales bacterium]